MRHLWIIVRGICFAVSGVMLCACSSNQTEVDAGEEDTPFGKQACFQASQVSGFRTLDRTNLIVYAPTRSSAYHVRISPPARELKFANTIAFDVRGTRICGHAGEGVVFESGGMVRKYFVTDVFQLDVEAAQNLIDQFSGDLTIESQNSLEAEIERDIE
jgi:hypothetical protein